MIGYQGEKIGMTNTDFTSIDQLRDVESLNHYEILQQKGISKEDALRIIQKAPWHDSAMGPCFLFSIIIC